MTIFSSLSRYTPLLNDPEEKPSIFGALVAKEKPHVSEILIPRKNISSPKKESSPILRKEDIIAEERIITDPKKEDIVADPERTFPPIHPLPKALADFKSKARSEGDLGEHWGIF